MSDFDLGSIFADRYEILELLGKGGMGMVYRVKDWQRQEEVALKTLLPKYAQNAQAVRRFAREVAAARKIDHPCVVKIFDARQAENTLFYTMEYLDGMSLRGLMRNRHKMGQNMGIGSTVRILSLLCHALESAHQFTIHRDISPENVMVLPNGDVKLLDFGLAKVENMDANLTRVGISLGKIQYGSPEQRIDAKNVDLRADIYSLGVMFYEMLVGELPTDDKKIVDQVDGLPDSSDAFFLKATAAHPDDRFQSAKEMRLALQQVYHQATGKTISVVEDESEPEAETPAEVEEALPKISTMKERRVGFGRLVEFITRALKRLTGRAE